MGSALGDIPNPSAIKPSPGFPQPTNTTQQPGQFPRQLPGKVAVAVRKELLRGGAGDGKPDSAFNRKALRKGVLSELEHTSNTQMAKEIAKDHLTEDSMAYAKEAKYKPPYKIRPWSTSGQECLDEFEERFMNSTAKKYGGESSLQGPMVLGAIEKEAASTKCAAVTPFAAAFFIQCRSQGYSVPQIQEFTKLASQASPKINDNLSCFDDNFWQFMARTTKQAEPGLGERVMGTLGGWGDSGMKWLQNTRPIQAAGKAVRSVIKPVTQPVKQYFESQLQQGAANEVGKRLDALGFNPEGGIGKFLLDYNKEGLMPAIGNAWGNMSDTQKLSLLAMIGGPLLGMGTAMAGHPGMGALLGLGGLAAGGAGLYYGGNNQQQQPAAPAAPKPPTPPQAPAQAPIEAQQQPPAAPQPAESSDWVADAWQRMRSSAGSQVGGAVGSAASAVGDSIANAGQNIFNQQAAQQAAPKPPAPVAPTAPPQ